MAESSEGNRSFRVRVVSPMVLFLFFNVLNAERNCNKYHFSFLKRVALGKENAVYILSRS